LLLMSKGGQIQKPPCGPTRASQVYGVCGRRTSRAGLIDRRCCARDRCSGWVADPTRIGLEGRLRAPPPARGGVDSAGSSGSSSTSRKVTHPVQGTTRAKGARLTTSRSGACWTLQAPSRPKRYIHDELQGPDQHALDGPTTPTGIQVSTRSVSGRSNKRSPRGDRENLLKPGQWLRGAHQTTSRQIPEGRSCSTRRASTRSRWAGRGLSAAGNGMSAFFSFRPRRVFPMVRFFGRPNGRYMIRDPDGGTPAPRPRTVLVGSRTPWRAGGAGRCSPPRAAALIVRSKP